MLLHGHRHQLQLELSFEILSSKLLEIRIFENLKKVNFVCCFTPSNSKPQSLNLPKHHTRAYMFCKFQQNWSSSFGDFEISTGTAHFQLPSSPARVTIIYKKFNYRKTTEPFSTIFRPQVERTSGVIQWKLRLLKEIQSWYFECKSIKNYLIDSLEFCVESVKVYPHCVCEISQRSESNCTFENQKIEITYTNYSSLNTWVTQMKQKWIIANMSNKNRIFWDMSRTLNVLETYGVIQIEFSTSTSVLPMVQCPPSSNYGLFLTI